MNPILTHQGQLRAACLRHRGPYQQIAETFARLEPIAEAAGLFATPAQLIAIYHDNPATVPAATLRSDAGLVIAESTALPQALTEVILAAGTYAHARHLGPYDALPTTWARLKEYLLGGNGPQRGNGPGYEIYRNNPIDTAPKDLVTDVFIPTA